MQENLTRCAKLRSVSFSNFGMNLHRPNASNDLEFLRVMSSLGTDELSESFCLIRGFLEVIGPPIR